MLSSSEKPGAEIFSDSFSVAHHGITHTHLDALCHFSYKGSLYNGHSVKEVTSKGAARLSIESARDGIFARGILIDIPELKGVPYLDTGVAIYPEDLDAGERKTGVRVKSGTRWTRGGFVRSLDRMRRSWPSERCGRRRGCRVWRVCYGNTRVQARKPIA